MIAKSVCVVGRVEDVMEWNVDVEGIDDIVYILLMRG